VGKENLEFKATIQPAADFGKVPAGDIMVCRHKLDGTFVSVSEACRKLLGYEPEELIGKQAYDFHHPDDIETISSQHHRQALLEDIQESIRYRFRGKDGKYRVMETVTNTRRDRQGIPIELETRSIAVD